VVGLDGVSKDSRTRDDGGVIKIIPGKALSTAAAIRCIFPFQSAMASWANRKSGCFSHGGEDMDLHNRHRGAERKLIQSHTQKAVGCRVKSKANILKDLKRGIGAPADNVRKMPGTAITTFGGLLVAEMLSITDLKEGCG